MTVVFRQASKQNAWVYAASGALRVWSEPKRHVSLCEKRGAVCFAFFLSESTALGMAIKRKQQQFAMSLTFVS